MSGSGRNALYLCASVLVIGLLFFARSVFAPVALSLFAVAVVWPVQRWLEARLPQLVALAISLLLTVLALGVLLALERVGHRAGRALDDRQRRAPAGLLHAADAMARKPRHLRRRHLPRSVRRRLARAAGAKSRLDRPVAGRILRAGARLPDARAARGRGLQGQAANGVPGGILRPHAAGGQVDRREVPPLCGHPHRRQPADRPDGGGCCAGRSASSWRRPGACWRSC